MASPTPLRQPRVQVLMGRVILDHVVIDDAAAADFLRRRMEAGEDPLRLVGDALEVGVRVLDREEAGASVEVLRGEMEAAITQMRSSLESAFGPDTGHVTRVLERHFGAGSSTAVQHQVRSAVSELLAEHREKLFQQFSSAEESNPLSAFQRLAVGAIRQSSDQQHQSLREMNEKLGALRLEVAKLQAEKERMAAVADEAARGTAKGRPYEEAVAEAIDAIAVAQGDDCDAVGDVRGLGGRKGDVVVDIDGCSGTPRGRIVFEAKNSRKSRKEALAELEEAMTTRSADYGVWVVPSEDRLPARATALREVGGDKLFVVYDPEESRLALEVAYSLARARVLMAKGSGDELDAAALLAETERAVGALEEVRRIKLHLTNATTGIEEARRVLEGMAERVRGHLEAIQALSASAASARMPSRDLADA